jgi:RNA polymerase sigma-70 factor, ECF subfamily
MSSSRINALFDSARSGRTESEQELFALLLERFRLIAHQRLWDRADAEEVIQDALLVVAREYRQLEVTVSFAAWAQKVVDNRILARIAANQIGEARQGPALEEVEPAAESGDDLLVSLTECVRRIGRVNRNYVRVLNLHCQGYDTEEVCRRLQLNRNTLYSLLHRGRALLKRCLETGDLK